MARPKSKAPSLRCHISGQSICTIDGRDFYLGPHESPQALARYAFLVAEYQKNGLRLDRDFDPQGINHLVDIVVGNVPSLPPVDQSDDAILIRHVTARYSEHAKKTYANSKAELARILSVCKEIEQHDGSVEAAKYGPKLLQIQRGRWVESGKARSYCNRLTCIVVRMFKWAVSQELVSESNWTRLMAVEPLRFGQTEAPETEPVKPVNVDVVRATAKHLPPIVKAMVRIHIATGMRPSELCTMRPCDIDRSGDEWIYRPLHHKNKSKGKARAIPIVGDAREAITDYLNRDPSSYCFSPAESVAWWLAVKRANRRSKVQPSQQDRSKHNPEHQPGDHYTQDSYRRAIARACKKAGVDQWHPYQLRHLNLTSIRDAMGAEHAQAIGGHSRMDMTEHYAKVSERKAIEAAKHAPTL